MKYKIAIGALVLVTTYFVWSAYDSNSKNKALESQLNMTKKLVEDLEQQVFSLEEKLNDTQQESVVGAIDDATDSMMEVWRSVIQNVEKELDSVEEKLKEFKDEMGGQHDDSQAEKKRT